MTPDLSGLAVEICYRSLLRPPAKLLIKGERTFLSAAPAPTLKPKETGLLIETDIARHWNGEGWDSHKAIEVRAKIDLHQVRSDAILRRGHILRAENPIRLSIHHIHHHRLDW